MNGASKLHIWQTLFKSKIWYQVVLIAKESKKAKKWLTSYIYKSMKTLMNVKGNVNMENTLSLCLGMKKDELVDIFYNIQMTRWMFKISEEHKEVIRNNLGMDP